jgi:ATP-dependent DNA helicase RecG
VHTALDSVDRIREPVPKPVREARGLLDRAAALELVHRPGVDDQPSRGLDRLKYDEAFVLQTILAQRRKAAESELATPRHPRPGGLLADFDAGLPFELTVGQREIGEVLTAELASDRPMHRLLQGEVGSGKTVVALRAMLAAIDAGGQAALLAPTEVLAAQHHRSITTMLGDLALGGMLGGAEHGTTVALLTGSQSAAARKRALLAAASGEAGIVVGTHALIQKHVQFADLALVVVDEQHRFGVEQRDALREKGIRPPHVLVMTATPIPRTVAMTVFGDMETSTLRELPKGRAPITTHVVDADKPGWVDRTWKRIGEEVAKGHQAYVVCPRIGDVDDGVTAAGGVDGWSAPTDDDAWDVAWAEGSEDGSGEGAGDGRGERGAERELTGVYTMLASLRANPALEGVRLEVLHGRLDADTKEATMRAFAAGEIDVLVATTVIEVGVDVPNASVMVVVDADRFGISQLHQLRGRVGRGSAPGLCLLMTEGAGELAAERLARVAATTDGFELAQVDLLLRREGDVLGARQSGRGNSVRHLRLGRRDDEQVISDAREDAFALVADDPELRHHPALAAAVAMRLDEEQAAWLERG